MNFDEDKGLSIKLYRGSDILSNSYTGRQWSKAMWGPPGTLVKDGDGTG